MFCPHCAKQVEENSKFCIYCGGSIAEPRKGATEEPNPQSALSKQSQPNLPQRTNLQENQYVKRGKDISKVYFSFALQVFKNPYKMSQAATERDFINGIISLILTAFLIPFYSYMAANKIGESFIKLPFFSSVIKPLFILLILLFAISGTLFLVGKMMKVDVNFKDVVAKFGTIMTVPVIFLLLANIFMLISVYVFSMILLLIGLGTMSLAMTATVFSLKSNQSTGGVDAYYGVFISYIIISILFLILGESIISEIKGQLESVFSNSIL